MKENKEIETVVSDVDKNGTKTFEVKKEKIYKRKDIITTAIIAFLIGAVLTAGGFAISKALNGGRKDRDFRTDGIQRNIEQKDINNDQKQNQSSDNKNSSNTNKKNYKQNVPSTNNEPQNNNQNPPSIPNNEQQPSNSNVAPSVPNNSDQNSTTNKS